MAKKETTKQSEENTRKSRKEILRDRKHEEQQRNIRIVAGIIGLILLLVLLIAVVNEFFLTPNKSVATVNGQEITLREWQDRVEFERAQRIINLESQLENFNGDVGLVQQFSGQAIMELVSENSESLGEAVLDRAVDEEIIRQAAEERDLIPSESEIDERIGSSFNYYGGDSPTPFPTPTKPVDPTPSLTPIPVAGEMDLAPADPLPSAPDEGPPSTPFPTATPVSEEVFRQEFDDQMAQYGNLGIGEQNFRNVVGSSIMVERVMDALADEQNLPEEDMHASMYFLAYGDEDEANQALDEIAASDYLTVWNTVRSRPPDPEAQEPSSTTASEILWRTRDGFAGGFGDEITEDVFSLPLNSASDLLVVTGPEGESQYIIIMVSGREMRELAENELQSRKQQLLLSFLDAAQVGDVEISEIWRSRVPTSPVLDPKFRQPPTPAPESGVDDAGGELTP